MTDTTMVDLAVLRVNEIISGLSGGEVAEVAAGLIGVAAMRERSEWGELQAAQTMSLLADLASNIGLDMRRLSHAVYKGAGA